MEVLDQTWLLDAVTAIVTVEPDHAERKIDRSLGTTSAVAARV